MNKSAKLEIEEAAYTFPIVGGTEHEHGINIATLRNMTRHVTLDDGYANTGSCLSRIIFKDGENGI